MKTKMMMICLVLVSWGAYAQHDHAGHGDDKKTDKDMAMFKDAKLGAAYEHYVHVKDALVASKADEAKMGNVPDGLAPRKPVTFRGSLPHRRPSHSGDISRIQPGLSAHR